MKIDTSYLTINDELNTSFNDIESTYPLINDPEFNIKISRKKEFQEIYNKNNLSLEEFTELENAKSFTMNSQQLFVRNFLSVNTPYNSLLLYHGLGTGKTCSSIGVAMEKIKYMYNTNIKKKIIFVSNPNVQHNFKQSLFDENKLVYNKNTNEWRLLTCVGEDILKIVNPSNENLDEIKIKQKIKVFINEWFQFTGYTKLSNDINESIRSKNNVFNNTLIIIDEIHNIRMSDDSKNKRIAENLTYLVKNSDNLQLLMLSATPMFDNYKEIIWLINLINLNDKRPIVSVGEIFDSDGNFKIDENGEEIGLRKFIMKLTGYVSFVKGEDPINFPYRVFPTDFDKTHSIFNVDYPKYQYNKEAITVPLKHIDLYTINLSEYQEKVYSFIMNELTDTTKNINVGYQIFQTPLNILNICYPCEYFDSIVTDTNAVYNKRLLNDNIGKNSLSQVFDDIQTLPFVYNSDYVNKYGKIFSLNELNKYSTKLHSICSHINSSEGISLVYSEKIYSGVLPMSLALEEMGYSRYNGKNLLSNKKKPGLKYIMITGNVIYSPDNRGEIEAITDKKNTDGSQIKVIIISRAGSEGIDLKNIRNVHVLEPWYNMNRTEQVIGRGIRNKSHLQLPFEKRNCSIYLYGSILTDNRNESIDLYLYRKAENKSIKIGRVSRVMKETATDCLLTQKEDVRFFKTNKSEVSQILSNKNEITYNIIKKAFSSSCDYMETCEYSCMIYDKKYEKIDINDDNVDISTYNENHMMLNVNDVIIRIKDLFKEKYFYTKLDIITRICINKRYSIDIINYALNVLINNELTYIFDRYDRKGKLVNINDMYLFQPFEINNKKINYEERIMPIHHKNKKLLIKFNDKTDNIIEKEDDIIDSNFIKGVVNILDKLKFTLDGSLSKHAEHKYINKNKLNKLKLQQEEEKERKKEVKQQYEEEKQRKVEEKRINKEERIYKKNLENIEKIRIREELKLQKEEEKNKLKLQKEEEKKRLKLQKEEENMVKKTNNVNSQYGGGLDISNMDYINIAIEIMFDNLSITDRLIVINKLLNNKVDHYSNIVSSTFSINEIITGFKNFVDNNTITNDFDMSIMVIGYTDSLKIVVKQNNSWIEGTDAYITLFNPLIKIKSNNLVNKTMSRYIGLYVYDKNKFTFKIKDNNIKDVRNKGARCSQFKRANIKELLSILYNIEYANLLFKNSEFKIGDFCTIIEYTQRYYDKISKENKNWFYNSIESAIVKYTEVIKI